MNEMVERVALTIAKRESEIMLGADRTKLAADPRALARAAMEAMREPTEEMLLAGHGANLCENAPEVWGAMIDEALK